MEDLREIFKKEWEKGERVVLSKVIDSYVAEVVMRADKEEPATINAVAGLLEAYSKLHF